jgi:predicted N-formylglutamate amidohydrolase
VVPGDSSSGIVLVCDHADNRVPAHYGNLGLPRAEFYRHIAYDPGAGPVTKGLAEELNAPAVLANFSRLLIDANRGEDDPTLIMRISDGTIVPGNARIDDTERGIRIATLHAPYHAAVTAIIDDALAAGPRPMIVSMHSFTPIWRGKPRPWHAGVLWAGDRRLAAPLLAALRRDPSLVVGDNEPYAAGLDNDSMERHGARRGLANAIIEIRQDLIADESGVRGWVARLASVLREINAQPEVHAIASGIGPGAG